MIRLELGARANAGQTQLQQGNVALADERLGLALILDIAGAPADIARPAARRLARRIELAGVGAGSPDEVAARVVVACRRESQELWAEPALAGAEPNFAAALFTGSSAVLGAAGRARCFRVRGRQVDDVTPPKTQPRLPAVDDDDVVEAAMAELSTATTGEAGREREAPGGDGGGGAAVPPAIDVCTLACEPGDAFALCSIGVWGGMSPAMLASAVGWTDSAEEACDRLIEAAWAGGGLASLAVAVARLTPEVLRLDPPGDLIHFPSSSSPEHEPCGARAPLRWNE